MTEQATPIQPQTAGGNDSIFGGLLEINSAAAAQQTGQPAAPAQTPAQNTPLDKGSVTNVAGETPAAGTETPAVAPVAETPAATPAAGTETPAATTATKITPEKEIEEFKSGELFKIEDAAPGTPGTPAAQTPTAPVDNAALQARLAAAEAILNDTEVQTFIAFKKDGAGAVDFIENELPADPSKLSEDQLWEQHLIAKKVTDPTILKEARDHFSSLNRYQKLEAVDPIKNLLATKRAQKISEFTAKKFTSNNDQANELVQAVQAFQTFSNSKVGATIAGVKITANMAKALDEMDIIPMKDGKVDTQELYLRMFKLLNFDMIINKERKKAFTEGFDQCYEQVTRGGTSSTGNARTPVATGTGGKTETPAEQSVNLANEIFGR